MPVAQSNTSIDNDIVRVTNWTFEPGQSTGEHRHEHDYVVVPLTDGITSILTTERRDQNELHKGGCYFRSAGAVHDVTNDGNQALVFVEIELKHTTTN